MQHYIVQARFKGKDGSLGYRKGKIYSLIVNKTPNQWGDMAISTITGRMYCPYKNWETFLLNWDILE